MSVRTPTAVTCTSWAHLHKLIMGARPQLTDLEIGRIQELVASGHSVSAIARRLNRSRTAISNYLKDPDGYGSKYRGGRPSAMTPREKRRVVKMASNQITSATRIKTTANLTASTRTITRFLGSTDILKYAKLNKAPRITKNHEKERAKWAEQMVDFGDKWNTVIFSDEKRWNLDGPDGLRGYWHDIRKEKRSFFSRQNGGGSVMVWAGIWASGKTEIAFLDGRQDSYCYIWTLSEFLLPAAHLSFGTDYIFQQDNAAIHTSAATRSFFQEQNVTVMDWPARSPDLNPIENVWGWLVRRVYAEGRQYNNVDELKSAIRREWKELDTEYLKKLILSMKRRCLQVCKRNGRKIDY